MFKAVGSRVNFPELEESVLAFWKEADVFAESVRQQGLPVVDVDWRPPREGIPRLTHTQADVSIDEANAEAIRRIMAGRPVIAYGAGGALDTVIEGETGAFFSELTPESLAKAVREFDTDTINPQTCVRNAMRFDTSVFKKQLGEFIDQVMEKQGA